MNIIIHLMVVFGVCLTFVQSHLSCHSSVSNDVNVFASMCEYRNPFTIPKVLNPEDVYPDRFNQIFELNQESEEFIRGKIVKNKESDSLDVDYVNTYQILPFEMMDQRYLLFQFFNGELGLGNFNEPKLNPHSLTNVDRDVASDHLLCDVMGLGEVALIVHSFEEQSFEVLMINDRMMTECGKVENVGEKIFDLKFLHEVNNLIQVILSNKIMYYKVDCGTKTIVNIRTVQYAGNHGNVNIRNYEYFGDFSGTKFEVHLSAEKMIPINLVYDDNSIFVVKFDEDGDDSIDFEKDTSALFYRTSDGFKIQQALLLMEPIRMVNIEESTCNAYIEFPSQQATLVVQLSKNEESRLEIVTLDEFAETIMDVSNPPKNIFSRQACDNGLYRNHEGNCIERDRIIHSFENQVGNLLHSFMDVPIPSNRTENKDEESKFNACSLYKSNLLNGKLRSICLEETRKGEIKACELEYFTKQDKYIEEYIFESFWYHQLYLPIGESQVSIYSVTPHRAPWMKGRYADTTFVGTSHTLTKQSDLTYSSRILRLTASPNAHHLFATLIIPKEQLASLQRQHSLCKYLDHYNSVLNRDKETPYFPPSLEQRYRDLCRQIPSRDRPYDPSTFIHQVSSCFPIHWCPSFTQAHVEVPPGGWVARRSGAIEKCRPGYWCTKGFELEAILGTIADKEGMERPVQCDLNYFRNTTCSKEGLQYELQCEPGRVCRVPSIFGLPSPPGYYTTDIGRESNDFNGIKASPRTFDSVRSNSKREIQGKMGRILRKCILGQWCVLNAHADNVTDIECPASAKCLGTGKFIQTENGTDRYYPVVCNVQMPSNDLPSGNISYCPAGAWEEKLCPLGYFCENLHSKSLCEPRYYCPEGTIIPKLCPRGYFCRNATMKSKCPYMHYCSQGSISPTLCSPFSFCIFGVTNAKQYNLIGAILILLAIFAVGITFKLSKIWQLRKKKSFSADLQENLISDEMERENVLKEESDALNVNLGFENLTLCIKGSGIKVVDNVSGYIPSGSTCCIMGPSGSGKSSLLTALAGRAHYGVTTGTVSVNGVPCKLTDLKKIMGFVPQHDIMVPVQTVKETIMFSAMTKLDKKMKRKAINRFVDNVIKVLDLERIKDSIVGDEKRRGISGGQKKRVNIGIEMAANPRILFLDEPTSGLDSTSSEQVCNAFDDIASNGTIVMTVIHQPKKDIFERFQYLILLGVGGKSVYIGKVKDAPKYFASIGYPVPEATNPADHYIDVMSGKVDPVLHPTEDRMIETNDLYEFWKDFAKKNLHQSKDTEDASEYHHSSDDEMQGIQTDSNKELGNEYLVPDVKSNSSEPEEFFSEDKRFEMSNQDWNNALKKEYKRRRVSWLRNFWVCLIRNYKIQIRDLTNIITANLVVAVGGLFLGLVFKDDLYVGPVPSSISERCPRELRVKCEETIYDTIIIQSGLASLTLSLAALMGSLSIFVKGDPVYVRETTSGLNPVIFYIAKLFSEIHHHFITPLVFLAVYYALVSPRAYSIVYYCILVLLHFVASGMAYCFATFFDQSVARVSSVISLMILQLFSGMQPVLSEFTSKQWYNPLKYVPHFSFLKYSTQIMYLAEIKEWKKLYDTEKSLKEMGYKQTDLIWAIPVLFLFGIFFRLVAMYFLWIKHPQSWWNDLKSKIKGYYNRKKQLAMHEAKVRLQQGAQRLHVDHVPNQMLRAAGIRDV